MRQIDATSDVRLLDLIKLAFRNIFSILYFTIVGLILGVIYISTMMVPEYTATGTLAMKTTTTTTVLNTITEIAKSSNVADLALLSLEEEGNVLLESGANITADFIRSGITASYQTTSLIIIINFSSTEETASTRILNAVLDATISYANANYTIISNNLMLGEYASNVIYTGQSRTMILLLSILFGSVLGLGIGLISDLSAGKILFSSDIYQLNVPAYHYIPKIAHENTPNPNLVKLQNSIESQNFLNPLKVIGLVSIDNKFELNDLIKDMGMQYASNNLRTLVIDLDLDKPSLHNTFNASNDYNIGGIVEEKYLQKPTLKKVAENFYFLAAKRHIYPSRVIKNPNFDKLLKVFQSEFDIILIKLTPYETSESSLLSKSFLDCLVVNVLVNHTLKAKLVKYINELYRHDFTNILVNINEFKERKNILNLFFRKKGV